MLLQNVVFGFVNITFLSNSYIKPSIVQQVYITDKTCGGGIISRLGFVGQPVLLTRLKVVFVKLSTTGVTYPFHRAQDGIIRVINRLSFQHQV